MVNEFLDKVKKIYNSFTPAPPAAEVFDLLASELPDPNHPLAVTDTPFITDAGQLTEPKVVEEFSKIVDEIIRQDNREEAVKAITLLQGTLLPLYPTLRQTAPDIYNHYQELLILLKFVALNTVPLQEAEKLVQENLYFAMQHKINVRAKIQLVLDDNNDILLEGKIAWAFANAIATSQYRLGKNYILFSGADRPLPATVGNYLREYLQASRSVAGSEFHSGAVERISYMTKSLNVRALSEENKKFLLRVLELYDWLRFGGSGIPVVRTNLPLPPAPRRREAAPVAIPKAPVMPVVKTEEPKITPSVTPLPRPPHQGEGMKKFPSLDGRGGGRVKEKPVIDEEVLKETLAELQKMRGETAKPVARSAPSPGPVGPTSPARGEENIEYKPFSVNEAIVRGKVSDGDHGEIVAGDRDIEEKLKRLEDKVKKN